ncbi:ubiquitin carboxyl-terminal hydrolase 47 isoform X2 [Chelmon rostratus]|nr:ubiquitin carboxyl-terminal hydrolase 47 isoform X2 [Chelmon rostratus]
MSTRSSERQQHVRVEMLREKLDSLAVSDYHGLKSPGLTCYLNSVLQVLFMTEDFREAMKGYRSKDSTTIDAHLGRLFDDLQKNVARTDDIIKKLGIKDVYEQHDAAEYFEKLLRLTNPEATQMFKGELKHKATCLECEERNDSTSSFWILSLAVKDLRHRTNSVGKGLTALFKGENVCRDNKMYCNRCNEKRDADFGCEITRSPEILTLLLRRFSFDYKSGCYVKLHSEVEVPQTLHIQDCQYNLYALVHHFGTLKGGHYTAQIKSFETKAWYCFNDTIVEGFKQPPFGAGHKSLSSCTAYLLMYRKVSRQEALCAPSHVDADESEGGEGGLVPDHQRMNESGSSRENLRHLNGATSKKNTSKVLEILANIPREVKNQLNQRAASMRAHKEMSLQTDTGADKVSYKPSWQTPKPDFGKPKKEQKSQEPDRQTQEHMQECNTRGRHTVQKVNESAREMQMNVFAKTGMSVTDSSLTRYGVKPAADSEEMQLDVAPTVTKRGSASRRMKINAAQSADKAKTEQWRF